MSIILTSREREIMVLAWQCSKSPVQVDYNKLADLANYKNAATAAACYSAAKKKMLSGENAKIQPREQELLSLSWGCFKSAPSVDFAKLGQLAKYKNAATAAACFSSIKNKFLSSASNTNDTTKTPKAVKTPTKKRKKAAAEYLTDSGAAEAAINDYYGPTKKKAKQEFEEKARIKEDPEETDSVIDLFTSAAKFLEDETENKKPGNPALELGHAVEAPVPH